MQEDRGRREKELEKEPRQRARRGRTSQWLGRARVSRGWNRVEGPVIESDACLKTAGSVRVGGTFQAKERKER